MRENFRSVPSAWWWILEEQGVNFINLISDSNYFLKKSRAFNLKPLQTKDMQRDEL